MAHAQKPDLVFQRNGRVHLYRRGRQFSRLLAAEVCGSAVVMLDRPCPIQCTTAGYPLHSPFPLHFSSRAFPCAITFRCCSTSKSFNFTYYFRTVSAVRRTPEDSINNLKVKLKVMFTQEQAMNAQRGEWRYGSTLSLTLALDGVGSQRHAPAALPPGKRPGTHCIGGWVGPRAGPDGRGKSRPSTGIRSPDRPARSQSLYRLSYPGPKNLNVKTNLNSIHRFRSYCAGNTLRLCYKSQSVNATYIAK